MPLPILRTTNARSHIYRKVRGSIAFDHSSNYKCLTSFSQRCLATTPSIPFHTFLEVKLRIASLTSPPVPSDVCHPVYLLNVSSISLHLRCSKDCSYIVSTIPFHRHSCIRSSSFTSGLFYSHLSFLAANPSNCVLTTLSGIPYPDCLGALPLYPLTLHSYNVATQTCLLSSEYSRLLFYQAFSSHPPVISISFSPLIGCAIIR